MTYAEYDRYWKALQEYLPPANRLQPTNLPEETFFPACGQRLHVDHYVPRSPSKGRVLLLHGVGGNGRLLSPIALPLWRANYEIFCPDLPLYGLTECEGPVSYELWVDCAAELAAGLAEDSTPLFVFGLSAGGLLAYQVACRVPAIRGILATCLLDQRVPSVRRSSAAHPLLGALAAPLTQLAVGPLSRLRLPMKAVTKMDAIVNDPRIARLLMDDRTAAGAMVPLSFLHGLLRPEIETEPEAFQHCPVLLLHPQEDRWTSLPLSQIFFQRLGAAKKLVLLEGAGHFPVESAGLAQLESACLAFLKEQGQGRRSD